MTEIDNHGGAVIGNQTVEQRHLSLDVGDFRYGRLPGQELGKRTLAGINIESRHRAALVDMKIGEQPRQQGLAHARPRRCDNGDRVAERHHNTGAARPIVAL